jgi:hypothetical protein
MHSNRLRLSFIILLGAAGSLEGCRRFAPGNYSGPQGNREATPDNPATLQEARAYREAGEGGRSPDPPLVAREQLAPDVPAMQQDVTSSAAGQTGPAVIVSTPPDFSGPGGMNGSVAGRPGPASSPGVFRVDGSQTPVPQQQTPLGTTGDPGTLGNVRTTANRQPRVSTVNPFAWPAGGGPYADVPIQGTSPGTGGGPTSALADQETPAPIVEASPRPGEKLSALATGELMPAPGSAASGAVSVRGDPGGGIDVDVTLRDAPPGTYAVVLGDTQDCAAIGAGGSRQGSAAGSAGVLGTIEVGAGGSGTLTTNLPRRPEEAALGTVVVVDQSTGRPTACGVTR